MREGRLSRFSVETSLSHRTKAVPRGKFLRFTIFLVSEKNIDKRGRHYHDFPSKLFSLIVPNHLVDEPSVFQEFSGMENYWGKESKRVSRFSIETFWSHRTETIRRGIFLRFTIFLVSEKIIDKRSSRYHDFPWKLFSLRVSNIFVEEPFWLPRTFWYWKLLRKKRGRMSRVFVEFFLSHREKNVL